MIKINFALLSCLFFAVISIASCKSGKKEEQFTIVDSILPIRDTNPKQIVSDTAIQVHAQTLSTDYIENEVRADKLYKGKLLVVTGTVQEISKGIAGDIYVIFAGANKQRTILCQFNHEDIAATLKKNDVISLKGRCDGLMGSVLMNNCEIDTSVNLK